MPIVTAAAAAATAASAATATTPVTEAAAAHVRLAADFPVGEAIGGGFPTVGGGQSNGDGASARAVAAANAAGTPKSGQSSNFRNVSACNRCRLRKNRCDQRLPSCVSCEKAGVACVGYDPITKREIPRSYVYYLETRVEQLEALLLANNIRFPPAEELEHSSTARSPTEAGRSTFSEQLDNNGGGSSALSVAGGNSGAAASMGSAGDGRGVGLANNSPEGPMALGMGNRLRKIATKPGMSEGHETVAGRRLGFTTGISFARVVFAAVQSSVTDQKSVSDKAGVRPYKPIAANGFVSTGTSMRDSFFGLHTKPTISPAAFPDRDLAMKLVTLYFQHANPQIPVLHREDFMRMFEQAYAEENCVRGPRELYMLNMVFAIGGGIIMGDLAKEMRAATQDGDGKEERRQYQPEEYHASAIVHLEACLSNSGGGLEELQAVLLLANFALLRPVPPGLWYIIGVAVRLAVDLGLYYEDGKDVDAGLSHVDVVSAEALQRGRGRREYARDLRRRLWWCTYSFDRLVSVSVGRPPGVPDQVMTTEFPSLLDDRYITESGFLRQEHDPAEPTYKRVAHHYFRLRLLQSEIVQVLQFQQAQVARATAGTRPFAEGKPFMNYELPCPYLANFDSFRSWRIDIDRRLYKWMTTIPPKSENGVAFSTEFLVLNYWQAIIMLYRQSLSVPSVFEGEYHTSKEVNSPTTYQSELREDEDRIYLKVAEAGQKILRLYRQLHLMGLVNYTYLATHHLFMAGISYLYAIWHSPIVRSRLTMDEVDFTILAATSVFSDLIEKCPPAEACRDAFDRTAKATIKMANAKGGFGQAALSHSHSHSHGHNHGHGYHARARSGSRGSLDAQRVDWSYSPTSEEPLAAAKAKSSHRRHVSHHPHQLAPPPPPPSSSQMDVVDSNSEAYPMSAPSQHYRMASADTVKIEGDGFSLMHTVPGVPRSNASSAELSGTPDGSMMEHGSQNTGSPLGAPSGGLPHVSPMQPSALSLGGVQAPPHAMTQQSVYTPTSQTTYSELQGMDFLQSLSGGGADGEQMFGGGVAPDAHMDMGFSFGWEGMHHDFNDGQQLDLFDGFFFGGQQSGGGGL